MAKKNVEQLTKFTPAQKAAYELASANDAVVHAQERWQDHIDRIVVKIERLKQELQKLPYQDWLESYAERSIHFQRELTWDVANMNLDQLIKTGLLLDQCKSRAKTASEALIAMNISSEDACSESKQGDS